MSIRGLRVSFAGRLTCEGRRESWGVFFTVKLSGYRTTLWMDCFATFMMTVRPLRLVVVTVGCLYNETDRRMLCCLLKKCFC
jgi:hypothetical protein